MLEALQRASGDLNESVNDCIEQLSQYNLGLQQSIVDQLRQVTERFRSFSDNKDADLGAHRRSIIARLREFEQSQYDALTAASASVRESIGAHAREAEAKISEMVEDSLNELEEMLKEPTAALEAGSTGSASEIEKQAGEYREQIARAASEGEDALARKAQDFESELAETVSEWKELISQKVEAAQAKFKERSAELTDELTKLVEESLNELRSTYESGKANIAAAIESGRSGADSTYSAWKTEIAEIYETFTAEQSEGRRSFEANGTADFDRKIAEAKVELADISGEARDKIQDAHRTSQESLNRLEQEYKHKFQSILSRFETAVAETARRSSSASALQQSSARGLQDKLRSQLNQQVVEIAKMVARLSQQLESEYVKSGQNMEDTIENIATASVESLEKCVQGMKNDLKKVTKSFQDELESLESDLSDIQIAGKKAAEMVMTYRSAMLSLGND